VNRFAQENKYQTEDFPVSDRPEAGMSPMQDALVKLRDDVARLQAALKIEQRLNATLTADLECAMQGFKERGITLVLPSEIMDEPEETESGEIAELKRELEGARKALRWFHERELSKDEITDCDDKTRPPCVEGDRVPSSTKSAEPASCIKPRTMDKRLNKYFRPYMKDVFARVNNNSKNWLVWKDKKADELPPCPNCGADTVSLMLGRFSCAVTCPRCMMRGPSTDWKQVCHSDPASEERAISNWVRMCGKMEGGND